MPTRGTTRAPTGVATAAAVALAVVGAGCGPRAPGRHEPVTGDVILLFHDRAVIRQHVDVEVPEASQATVTVSLAAGTAIGDVVVLDRGKLTISTLRAGDSRTDEAQPDAPPPPPDARSRGPGAPTIVTFSVGAPSAGHYAVDLGYVTDRLSWSARYTLTTTPARDQASLAGTIKIHNGTGLSFAQAQMFVVDAPLGRYRDRLDELVGRSGARTAELTRHPLGRQRLGAGDTEIDLLPGVARRPLRPVLVYDPVGTTLDHDGVAPVRDPSLGIAQPSRALTEGLELPRPAGFDDLPGGPVRVIERRLDDRVGMVGAARLFDAATRDAAVEQIALGTAAGVTGHRERREVTIDDDRRRIVEEFVLTIRNTRLYPVEVVLREHLYRGQNWTLAFHTAASATKDGPQQISLRTIVPAKGEARVLYVVVYTWP